MKIAILDDYQDCVRSLDCFSLLEGHAVKVFTNSARGLGQLSIRLAPFAVLVLIGSRSTLSRVLLDKLPNLKLIVQIGPLSSHVDVSAAAARGIRTMEGSSDPAAVAELSFGLMLAAHRKIVPYVTHLKEGLWQTASLVPARNTLGLGLRGQTLGIWGYGRVGQLVAGYGKAFGMRISIWGSQASREQAVADGYRAVASKAEFFAQSDIVSLHLRLTDATHGGVTSLDLGRMQTTALLVNTSHAALIEAGALQRALELGRPGQAALDVFDTEPAGQAPLLQMENVLATPHLGHVEQEGYERAFRVAFAAIVAFVNSQTPPHAGP